MSRGPAARSFDAVVVGAGVAGLAAASSLARAGRRVALLEAGDRCGGLCRTVRAGGHAWDLSLYGLRGCGTGGAFAGVLEELGIAGRIRLRHRAASYLVRLGGAELPVTTAREEMLEAAGRLVRGGADRLRPFLERIAGASPVRDYAGLRGLSFADVAATAGIRGPLLAALGAPLMLALGLPPERASAYFSFLKYRLLLEGGVSHPEGGAARLTEAFEGAFVAAGGTLELGERVEAVRVGSGGAKEVAATHGTHRADVVVLAVDAGTAISWLADALPERLVAKPSRLTPALSAELLFCAAPPGGLAVLGLDRAPQVVELATPDLLGLYRRLRAGVCDGTGIVGLTSPAAWRDDGEDEGQIPLAAFFPAPAAGRRTDPAAGELLPRLRAAVPRLPPGTEALGAHGPRSLATISGSPGGSFCGWEMGPERYGSARIPQRLPVPGVFLAGHWTEPGPSVLNAALSGLAAARAILGR